METIGSQQPRHHLPVGLLCFQKEVLAATNAAQQKALTCPLNAKPTLGIFLVFAAPGDSCNDVLFLKSCRRHCVRVWMFMFIRAPPDNSCPEEMHRETEAGSEPRLPMPQPCDGVHC